MKEYSYGIIPYIFDSDGVSILLCKSSEHSEYGFVKGKIDFGETPKECAVRESFEEIGIQINIDDLEDFVFQKNPKKDIGLFYISWHSYTSSNFQLDTKEIYAVKWFNISKLPNIVKNQRSISTEIIGKFEKLNFLKQL